jgi:UDP-glucose 4-epimerase
VLVHGVGAQGNLGRLLKSIRSAAILPFGSVRNRRSFIGVDNLADAILAAATAPWPGGPEARASRVYHLADDGVISTRRLVEVLAEGMGVIPHLISVPRWLAVGGATLLGKGAVARRLFDDLEVDDSDFRRDIAWKPSVGLEDGLRRMAEDYARRMRDGIPT